MVTFQTKLDRLQSEHEALLSRPNKVDPRWSNGVFERYQHPVVTAAHTPLYWRYDFDPQTNPFLMERMGINGTFNTGAIELEGKVLLMLRVEGSDRKSFFAVAESKDPVVMPETDDPDTNVYDMRLTQHEDGWIYGGRYC